MLTYTSQHLNISYMFFLINFLYASQLPEREFLLRVSYMEIYNEMVRDLLSDRNENLKLQEDQVNIVYFSCLHILKNNEGNLNLS